MVVVVLTISTEQQQVFLIIASFTDHIELVGHWRSPEATGVQSSPCLSQRRCHKRRAGACTGTVWLRDRSASTLLQLRLALSLPWSLLVRRSDSQCRSCGTYRPRRISEQYCSDSPVALAIAPRVTP